MDFAKIFLTNHDAEAYGPADEPTSTPPGSEARMAVYRQRVEKGQDMFHKDDVNPGVGEINERLMRLIGDRHKPMMNDAGRKMGYVNRGERI